MEENRLRGLGLAPGLAQALSADPLREKILLTPTLRLGRQWLEQAAALAGGAVNCRLASPDRLARDLASADLRRLGRRPASRPEKIRQVGLALARLARERRGRGYFTRLPPSLALAETLLYSLEEIEQSGAEKPSSRLKGLTPPEKAAELGLLIRRYHYGLRRNRLAGNGEVLAAALAALRESAAARPLLLAPEPLIEELPPGQRRLLAAWPAPDRLIIPESGAESAVEPICFAADRIANEAREVFRRLQALGLPLDQAEAVCLDEDAYAPALCAAAREMFGGRLEDLPLTCAGGLPADASRPARLLLAWLEWLRQSLPPAGLAALVSAGFLDGAWRREEADCPQPHELAARLRQLPLTGNPGEYREVLGRRRSEGGKGGVPDAALARLADFLEQAIPDAHAWNGPDWPGRAGAVLQAALRLLRLPQPEGGKLDAYAALALVKEIETWLPLSDWPGFDALSWLDSLASGLKVMGLGPQPGRLHVGGLFSGGQAGRGTVFVLGLDDSRFPGPPRRDPVLSDAEREAASGLRLSGHWPGRREAALSRLLRRTPERVFLSHARMDDRTGQELFPAAIWQKQRPGPDWEHGDEEAAGLVPDAAEKCLRDSDDWLRLFQAGRRGGRELGLAGLAPWFPGLAQGEAARLARESGRFTEYDGRVPEAGRDFLAGAGTLSPTGLERLAACPLEFFFVHILGVRSPERFPDQPGQWLPGAERGNLLHRLFQNFAEETALDEIADEERWRSVLNRRLTKALEKAGREFPAADPLTRRREERILTEACDLFLAAELVRRRRGRPVWWELPLGKSHGGVPPWNQAGELIMDAGAGRRLRLKGQLDRVDRLKGGGLAVIDFKTGRADHFSPSDPFRQGRQLQPFLYAWMLEEALAGLGLPEEVREFTYSFPMPRDEGTGAVTYRREDLLRGGKELVERLAALLESGCFSFTTHDDDVANSDFLPVYGDVKELAARAGKKAADDKALAGWAELREAKT